METSENKFEIIHETIHKANNRLYVKMLCEIAGVFDSKLLQLGTFGRKKRGKGSARQSRLRANIRGLQL